MFRTWVNLMIASMIFFPVRELSMRPSELGLTSEDIWCKTEDGVRIHGWFLPSKQRGGEDDLCLIFFHGNADNISIRLPKVQKWIERGISVLLVDYRGYGQSEGEIKHGDNLYQDARAAYRSLHDTKGYGPSEIILYGESIGSVPTVELATQERFRAVILEAPLTSLKELAKQHYGWVPDILLKDFQFNNESKIGRLKSPLFILHGTEDEIVPVSMGKRLFDEAPEPKNFFEIKGAHHNDIDSVGGDAFFEAPYGFVLEQSKTL